MSYLSTQYVTEYCIQIILIGSVRALGRDVAFSVRLVSVLLSILIFAEDRVLPFGRPSLPLWWGDGLHICSTENFHGGSCLFMIPLLRRKCEK